MRRLPESLVTSIDLEKLDRFTVGPCDGIDATVLALNVDLVRRLTITGCDGSRSIGRQVMRWR